MVKRAFEFENTTCAQREQNCLKGIGRNASVVGMQVHQEYKSALH